MPLKPIFDKAPLMTMSAQPLCAGLVRMENAAMSKLYEMTAQANDYAALEGTFRLACIVTVKPGEEPVAAKIRAVLATQNEDGSFPASFTESVAILRAAWSLYEFEPRKSLLDHIAHWCGFAVKNWDALMADNDIWVYSADLLELLENLYRVTGKASVLTLCERVATQTMGWSSVLNTISAQRPTNKAVAREDLTEGLRKENGSREGYYNHFVRTNHAETLADGARSTMAKGWYSGSATELNAAQNGWERLVRHHGAVCGGLTSDELLEGTSPAELVSTAALGAWAEALCSAAMSEKSSWAFEAVERMAYNAMPSCLLGNKLSAFQRVNTVHGETDALESFCVLADHEKRAMNRLVRGYAALASSCVTVHAEGANVNLYMSGRYAVPVGENVLVLNNTVTTKGASITVHCRQEIRATIRLRMPVWSRNTEVVINGAGSHEEVKNGMISYGRVWHDGDVITVSFDAAVRVADGHHQGKFVLYGPVLMTMPAEGEWKKALVSASYEDNRVVAVMDRVEDWKTKGNDPADIPVLPATAGAAESCQMVPYARAKARIALFPGRKQA